MVLNEYEKQPYDDKDYDIDFGDWLVEGDELFSATATVECTSDPDEDPAELEAYRVDLSSRIVKVWCRGGTADQKYKVTVRVVTSGTPPRKDESELKFTVKDT